MRTFGFVVLVVSCLLITACGGGGGSTVDTAGGKVVDGYVQGAWIYVVPTGETTAANALFRSTSPTDAQGNFTFAGIQSFITANSGNATYQLISIGGTNTSTQAPVPQGTVYTAPLGSKVLTPLTTLVMQTATILAGSAPLSPDTITQAIAKIAAVSGMDPAQAANVILNMDPMATATTDSNVSKALALELIVAQLAAQKVVDANGSFSQTVNALANQLVAGNPMNVVALATNAALSNPASQNQAAIISGSILSTVNEVTAAAQSQSSTSFTPASLMAQMESQLTANLASNLSGVNGQTDVNAVSNAVTNTTTAQTIGQHISTLDKTAVPANLQDAAVTGYLLKKASEGGISQLLGIDVLTIPSGNVAVQTASRVAGKLGVFKGPAKSVAAVANPCSGMANSAVVPMSCGDILGADLCTNAADTFQASLSCNNHLPDTISISLNGFSGSIFGSGMSGTIKINNSAMTFADVTDGATVFNGTLGYGPGSNGALDFAVKNMTVLSPMWSTLNLDSFSRGSIIPAASGGQNDMVIYISGSGILAGSNVPEKISLNYERRLDTVKTLVGSQYTDNSSVNLNGQVSQGGEVVKFANFGLSEQRFYQGAADQDFLYKLSSFTAGSKLASSKYGYAFFSGNDLRFNYDQVHAKSVYQSGSMALSLQ